MSIITLENHPKNILVLENNDLVEAFRKARNEITQYAAVVITKPITGPIKKSAKAMIEFNSQEEVPAHVCRLPVTKVRYAYAESLEDSAWLTQTEFDKKYGLGLRFIFEAAQETFSETQILRTSVPKAWLEPGLLKMSRSENRPAHELNQSIAILVGLEKPVIHFIDQKSKDFKFIFNKKCRELKENVDLENRKVYSCAQGDIAIVNCYNAPKAPITQLENHLLMNFTNH